MKTPAYDFAVTDNQRAFADNAIMITGAPRSGTTIVGKIIGTLKGVDYHYEPATLYMISSLVASGHLAKDAAADLLRVYLYEDLLVESAHGRRANLRPGDDSLILNQISWPQLVERWTKVRRRADAARLIRDQGWRVAFKMPDAVDSLGFFLEALPKSQAILTARDGRHVVKSIIKKGWTRDEALQEELWPYRRVGSRRVPYWVEDDYAERWLLANEATRSCYMWRILAQWGLNFLDSPLVKAGRLKIVRYEELLADPAAVVKSIAEYLGRETTELTTLRTQEVCVPESMAPGRPSDDFFRAVAPDELEHFLAANARWGYR